MGTGAPKETRRNRKVMLLERKYSNCQDRIGAETLFLAWADNHDYSIVGPLKFEVMKNRITENEDIVVSAKVTRRDYGNRNEASRTESINLGS